MSAEIKSNMTGSILEILVKVGDTVAEEQDVVSIESMKMEMNIASDFEGKVKEIKIAVEDFVQEGDVLMVLE